LSDEEWNRILVYLRQLPNLHTLSPNHAGGFWMPVYGYCARVRSGDYSRQPTANGTVFSKGFPVGARMAHGKNS
jgi:hypothetical protein